MFRRRSEPLPELPLDRADVMAIFAALADIKKTSIDIIRILSEEDDEEEADEP